MKDGWKEIREGEIKRVKPLLVDKEIKAEESVEDVETQIKKVVLDKNLSQDAVRVLLIILLRDKNISAKQALENNYMYSRGCLYNSLRELENNNYLIRINCKSDISSGGLGAKWFYSFTPVENIRELAFYWAKENNLSAVLAGKKGFVKPKSIVRPSLKKPKEKGEVKITPSLRFKVLKRDNFTCQYCGRKAPKVELQVDHIIPTSKKGKDKLQNLITSCRECNIGKSNRELKEKQVEEFQWRAEMNGKKL